MYIGLMRIQPSLLPKPVDTAVTEAKARTEASAQAEAERWRLEAVQRQLQRRGLNGGSSVADASTSSDALEPAEHFESFLGARSSAGGLTSEERSSCGAQNTVALAQALRCLSFCAAPWRRRSSAALSPVEEHLLLSVVASLPVVASPASITAAGRAGEDSASLVAALLRVLFSAATASDAVSRALQLGPARLLRKVLRTYNQPTKQQLGHGEQ